MSLGEIADFAADVKKSKAFGLGITGLGSVTCGSSFRRIDIYATTAPAQITRAEIHSNRLSRRDRCLAEFDVTIRHRTSRLSRTVRLQRKEAKDFETITRQSSPIYERHQDLSWA